MSKASSSQQGTGHSLAARWLFLLGLTGLLIFALAYVWIQEPLRASVKLQHQLAKNVGRIMTLDEVLTMSARMAASGHPGYQARYDAHVGELEAKIKQTLALVSDAQVMEAVRSTDDANARLVDMESKSFELDKAGRYAEALHLVEGPAYRSDKALYARGMERAFSRLEHLTWARRQVVERWATLIQAAVMLSLFAVLAAWTLEQRERRRQAARYAAGLEATVELRTRELAERNQAMRLVLDSVQQGLIGVDLEGWMSAERSAVVARWFGAVSGRRRLADYVQPHDPSFATSFEMGLEQLREDILPFDLCVQQLPKRIEIGDRTLAVEYETMLANGKCTGFLLVMSDITLQLERQRIEAEQRDLVRVLECVGRDRSGFLHFLEESNRLVEELIGSTSAPLTLTLRLVHTLKGNSAQFGISTVARVCHDIEDQIGEQGQFSARERQLLESTWRAFRDQIRSVMGDRSQTHMEIARSDYRSVVKLIGHKPDCDDILEALHAWELEPVQTRLGRLGEYARGLAERLGKPGIELVCDAHALRADASKWASFWAVCVHLVRNAIDHGLEEPAARTAAGKATAGKLTLDARRVGDEIVIRVIDDGRGIAWDALVKKAIEQGLAFEGPEQRLDALFQDGISSRANATETSGRGIGMAAVRAEIQRRDGTIAVSSELGHGTTIEMRFAADTMLDTAYLRAFATDHPPRAEHDMAKQLGI